MLLVLQIVLIQVTYSQMPGSDSSGRAGRLSQEQWIAGVMDTLSLEQKIGQLIVLPVDAATSRNQLQDIEDMVSRHHVGGIIFRQGNPVQYAGFINSLQQKAGIPLLMGIDAGQGLGSSLDSAQHMPGITTLGAVQDKSQLFRAGAEIARQCRMMGIHLNFSPAISIGFQQQEAGEEVFGEDEHTAFLKATAWMEGMESYGVLACFRRSAPPVYAHLSGEQQAGTLPGEMVAHLSTPLYEQQEPARSVLPRESVSATDLVNQYLELEGLVFSEPLTGLRQGGNTSLEVAALQAGNDMLLFPAEVTLAVNSIRKSVAEGVVSQEDIDRRVEKVLRAKYQVGLDSRTYVDTTRLLERLNSDRTRWVKQQLYEAATTLVHNKKELLPVRVLDTASFASLALGASLADEEYTSFQQTLNLYAPFVHYSIPRGFESLFDYEVLFNRLKRYSYVVVSLHDEGGLSAEQAVIPQSTFAFLKFLDEATNVVVVVFGKPYLLSHFEHFGTLLCAYENDALAQKVVPQIMFGALPGQGRLPVRVSGRLTAGMGVNTDTLGRLAYTFPEAVGINPDTLLQIDSLAHWAIRERATPGCQVLVARHGKVFFHKSYGYQTYDSLMPVTNETIYDIASVTKVAATLQGIMFLEERGAIALDEKVAAYLPELTDTDKKDMTVRDVLLHRAGFRSHIPFWQMTRNHGELSPEIYSLYPVNQFDTQIASGLYAPTSLKDSLWNWTIHSRLITRRGKAPLWKPRYNYRYSDLSFYVLYNLIERVARQPLDNFLEQNFYTPLGLSNLTYLPLCKHTIDRIAPTEEDNLFRNTLVRGTVHDEGAALCGGVAGHAGLFSNANDLAVLMQMNLQEGLYGGTRYLQPGTVRRFSVRQFNDSRRGLGWDKPEYKLDGGPTAPEASYASYGHLGFTGTAVWVDPKYDLVYIFLSNRIHPDARNTKLLTEGVRTKIQSVVYRAMEDYQGR